MLELRDQVVVPKVPPAVISIAVFEDDNLRRHETFNFRNILLRQSRLEFVDQFAYLGFIRIGLNKCCETDATKQNCKAEFLFHTILHLCAKAYICLTVEKPKKNTSPLRYRWTAVRLTTD